MSTNSLHLLAKRTVLNPNILKNIAILAFLGATFGTFFDFMHVITGTTGYQNPYIWGVAWWTPLLFAGASLLIGLSHPFIDKVLHRKQVFNFTPVRLLTGFTGLCLVWLATAVLPFSSVVVTMLLLPVCSILWFKLDRTKEGALIALLTAFLSCIAEIVLSANGFFYHIHNDLFGIPFWLPCIYLAASTGLGNIGRWLSEQG